MTSCNFRVGQKVVCVDDKPYRGGPEFVPVKEGEVYTVAGVTEHGVFLDEVRAVHQAKGYGFLHERFRPVVQRKTDISIFRALLTPSKEKVETAS